MAELYVGQSYDLTVGKYVGTESFPNNMTPGKTNYGHKYILHDEEINEYAIQIVDAIAKPSYFDAGDLVSIQIKSKSHSIYSVRYVRTIEKAPILPNEPEKPAVKNPGIGGTAAAMALSLTVEHLKYHEGDVFELADKMYDWLIKKA
jgi:hypothetical protein